MRQLWTENLRSVESGSFQRVLELVQAGVSGATVSASPRGSLDGEARRIVQALRARHIVEVPVGSATWRTSLPVAQRPGTDGQLPARRVGGRRQHSDLCHYAPEGRIIERIL